jgi:hypothetical protein
LIAASRLRQEACHEPIHALVVGRVTKTQEEKMFGWQTDDPEIGRETIEVSDIEF